MTQYPRTLPPFLIRRCPAIFSSNSKDTLFFLNRYKLLGIVAFLSGKTKEFDIKGKEKRLLQLSRRGGETEDEDNMELFAEREVRSRLSF